MILITTHVPKNKTDEEKKETGWPTTAKYLRINAKDVLKKLIVIIIIPSSIVYLSCVVLIDVTFFNPLFSPSYMQSSPFQVGKRMLMLSCSVSRAETLSLNSAVKIHVIQTDFFCK